MNKDRDMTRAVLGLEGHLDRIAGSGIVALLSTSDLDGDLASALQVIGEELERHCEAAKERWRQMHEAMQGEQQEATET